MRRNFVYRAVAFVGALALSALAGRAEAQTGTAVVRGTVVDSSTRQPVPNAQVSVGTARRVLTDDAGRYTIGALPAGATTVRVQRIGFGASQRTVTLAEGQTSVVDFTLRPAAAVLSSVVTVGYGTSSRAEVSNAIAQVSGEEVQGAAVAGLDAALQGKAPGVQVVQNAGNPGNGITVRVRGSSSISASNQPLYVIDGLPMIRENLSQMDYGGQDITAVTGLSPDEIETIDVLKDAAAAAIYGSRASNGVVMITTKRGRPGTTRFTFNSYVGQQHLARRLDLMNSAEYAAFFSAAFANDETNSMDELGVEVNDLAAQYDTDWEKAVTRDAAISDVSMQVQGGGDRFQYMLSGSRFDQPGIVIASGYNRLNSRLNLDFTATPKFQLRSSIGVAREEFLRIENDNTIEGTGANAMANPPIGPIRRADGTYAGPDDFVIYSNPVALGDFDEGPAKTHRLLGSLEGAYSFTDRVRLTGRLGADVYDLDERNWDSPRVEGTYASGAIGVGTQTSNTATRYVAEAWTNVDPFRDDRQSLGLTAGGSVEYNRNELVYLRGEGFGNDQFQYPGNAGKVTDYDGRAAGNNLVSLFGRANYSLLNRYLLTASLRTDGSSRFSEGQRFGVFPAASIGWTISEEPSLTALRNIMSLKLRASYGETGNQAIPTNFGFLTSFARANYSGEPGLAPNALGNPDLKWETTHESDVGADLGFFDGRLSVI
ncbi:MAG: SusC/RagA family TonB-linked outer membrane protein, partial [Gemmatimonadaceae bacterium]